jgi:dTDP-4-dehydrorhamnose 3,5-epimerase
MGEVKTITGIILSPLKIINHPNGDLYHIMRNFDNGFMGFGEVYISTINYGSIKAWKKHLKMTCNFVVPVGSVKMVVCDRREGSDTFDLINEYILSRDNYFRLTIPPGLWYGFAGITAGENMMLNLADITHDPAEQVNVGSEEININYEW